MSKIEDGGAAFPSVLYSHERAENWSTDGMSLRDWFAGQALIMLGGGFNPTLPGDRIGDPWPEPEVMPVRQARYAYLVADAMIKERDK